MYNSHHEDLCTSFQLSRPRTQPRHFCTYPQPPSYQPKTNTLSQSHTPKLTKGTIKPFVFLKYPWRVKKITCAIKGRKNCTRGFNVEEDEGVFGIFGNHVFEAPRERVHALLTFVDGHEDFPFLCCHVSHRLFDQTVENC